MVALLVVWHLVGMGLVVLAGLRLACVVGVYCVFLAFAVDVRLVFLSGLRLVFVVEQVELRRPLLLLLVGSPLLLLVCRPLCVLEVDSEDGLDGDGDDLQPVDAQQLAVAVEEVAGVRERVRAGDWQVVAHDLSCG